MLAAIVKSFGEHFGRAVDGGDVETGLEELNGVKPRASGDVENALFVTCFQNIDEKAAFTSRALIPIDEFIPLLDKTPDIFRDICIGLPNLGRIIAVVLLGRRDKQSSRCVRDGGLPFSRIDAPDFLSEEPIAS
jgi:hypothetical protein